jgi:hypothetical protein
MQRIGVGVSDAPAGRAEAKSERMIAPRPHHQGRRSRPLDGDCVEVVAGLGKSLRQTLPKAAVGSLFRRNSNGQAGLFFGQLWRKRYIKARPSG